MRWLAGLGWVSVLLACGPSVGVGGGTTGTTGESAEGPMTSTTITTTLGTSTTTPIPTTTVPGTTLETDGDTTSGSDTTGVDSMVPDFWLPPACNDADCPAGQVCGNGDAGCIPMEEIVDCEVEAPTHRVAEIAGVTGTPVALRVADVDGDMDDDVIVLWDNPPGITVVQQDVGLVALPVANFTLADPLDLEIGDMDADTVPDLVILAAAGIRVADGLGDGTFPVPNEILEIAGVTPAGFGVGRGSDDDADDIALYTTDQLTLVLNDGTGAVADALPTNIEIESPGAFAAVPRNTGLLAMVGSLGRAQLYSIDDESGEFAASSDYNLTNADEPIVDVDLAPSGGAVHTFAFVHLQDWTYGGFAVSPKGIPTRSRLVIGNALPGYDFVLVTEDDRLLVVDSDCYEGHTMLAPPIAADAGDLDGDGEGDLAVIMDGVPLTLLLSTPA